WGGRGPTRRRGCCGGRTPCLLIPIQRQQPTFLVGKVNTQSHSHGTSLAHIRLTRLARGSKHGRSTVSSRAGESKKPRPSSGNIQSPMNWEVTSSVSTTNTVGKLPRLI